MLASIRLLLIVFVVLPRTAILQELNWSEEQQKFQENVQRWNSLSISQYSYLAESKCLECYWYFPAVVSVTDGEIVSIIDPVTGSVMRSRTMDGETRAIFPEELNRYLTIEDIFGKIEEAIRNREGAVPAGGRMAEVLSVAYDERYGFPTSLYIRYGYGRGTSQRVMDDRVNIEVREFTPLR